MASSKERVRAAAENAELMIDIVQMPESTRTAEEAAVACGCTVAQIIKSLIFEGTDSGEMILLLVSGTHQADMDKAAALAGEPLKRADPRRVREVTGFAIGGVAPIGHLTPLRCWIDKTLLTFDTVWAAAGAPNAVFSSEPNALARAADATPADLA
jgi:prolyl-tRNA editing enzyme YbaK/EbsC (Cys-tRNA(Pro) deacylase)